MSRHRRSIRLENFDYRSPGLYFVTVLATGRRSLFGAVAEGQMHPNDCGRVVQECWLKIPIHFPHAALGVFTIMPNHIHGILVIAGKRGAAHAAGASLVGATHASPLRAGPMSGSVGAIVGSFKSASANRINLTRGTPAAPVWQRNYYEHVIRDGTSLGRVRRYIAENPLRWQFDPENSTAAAPDRANPW